MTHEQTSTRSLTFRIRRMSGVLVIESRSSELDVVTALREVFDDAVNKSGPGIIVHLPMPKYITSLFLLALKDVAQIALDKGRPFFVVAHPKLRLLIEMFELSEQIPTTDRLDRAVEAILERSKSGRRPAVS